MIARSSREAKRRHGARPWPKSLLRFRTRFANNHLDGERCSAKRLIQMPAFSAVLAGTSRNTSRENDAVTVNGGLSESVTATVTA